MRRQRRYIETRAYVSMSFSMSIHISCFSSFWHLLLKAFNSVCVQKANSEQELKHQLTIVGMRSQMPIC